MGFVLKFTILVVLTACYATTVNPHVCMLQKRRDPHTNRERWSLPITERCFCQGVVTPKRRSPNACYNDDKGEENVWFTDDPEPLTHRQNWTPENLDLLLERKDFCARDKCSSNPCQNGGSCQDIFGGFICACSQGFEGQVCENDVEAPTFISCPTNQTIETDPGESTAAFVWSKPETTDNSGHNTTVTCNSESGSKFVIGQTKNTCEARDASGNKATCTFTVVITDAEAPNISCPGDQTVWVNPGKHSAVVKWDSPNATDNSEHDITATCNAESPITFEVGKTDVVCIARDASGNSASCSFIINIVECQRPLGMKDKSISDIQITVSSESSYYHGTHARLNNTLFWLPDPKGDSKPWIRVDLISSHTLTGVITQGGSVPASDIWVKTFYIKYETPTTESYIRVDEELKLFSGNTITPVTNMFDMPVIATAIQIEPQSCVFIPQYAPGCALRLEILGCRKDG